MKNVLPSDQGQRQGATRHVTIVVSGSLTQNDDQINEIAKLISPAQSSLFCLDWDNKGHMSKLRKLVDNATSKLGFDINMIMTNGNELSLFKHLLTGQ